MKRSHYKYCFEYFCVSDLLTALFSTNSSMFKAFSQECGRSNTEFHKLNPAKYMHFLSILGAIYAKTQNSHMYLIAFFQRE